MAALSPTRCPFLPSPSPSPVGSALTWWPLQSLQKGSRHLASPGDSGGRERRALGGYKIITCSGGCENPRAHTLRAGQGRDRICSSPCVECGEGRGQEGQRCHKDRADSGRLWDPRVVPGTGGEGGLGSCLWMASDGAASWLWTCDTAGTCGHARDTALAGPWGAPEPTWDVEMLGPLVRGWSGGPHIYLAKVGGATPALGACGGRAGAAGSDRERENERQKKMGVKCGGVRAEGPARVRG